LGNRPFTVLKQPKWPVYQSLYNLNAAFQSIALEIERLADSEAIPRDTLRMTAEELRSGINHYIIRVLLLREEKDWNRYGKEVRKVQEKLKTAGNRLQATGYRQEQEQILRPRRRAKCKSR